MNDVAFPKTTPDWRVLAYPAGIAVAHIVLLLVSVETLLLLSLALVEGGVVLVLISSLLRSGASAQVVGAFLGTFVGLGSVTIATLYTTDSLWVAALILGLVAATLTYGLHRYGLVRVNIVESKEADQ